MQIEKSILNPLSYSDIVALAKLEKKAHKWQEDSCNYNMSERTETRRDNIINREIVRIFGETPAGFFINGDPRGAALKIDPEHGDVSGLITDWGGYGMLGVTAATWVQQCNCRHKWRTSEYIEGGRRCTKCDKWQVISTTV